MIQSSQGAVAELAFLHRWILDAPLSRGMTPNLLNGRTSNQKNA
jgi:hypothetical protein